MQRARVMRVLFVSQLAGTRHVEPRDRYSSGPMIRFESRICLRCCISSFSSSLGRAPKILSPCPNKDHEFVWAQRLYHFLQSREINNIVQAVPPPKHPIPTDGEMGVARCADTCNRETNLRRSGGVENTLVSSSSRTSEKTLIAQPDTPLCRGETWAVGDNPPWRLSW